MLMTCALILLYQYGIELKTKLAYLILKGLAFRQALQVCQYFISAKRWQPEDVHLHLHNLTV